jgi:gamma-glutamylcyclotransferase (GGCT)/AIG2-like uncharacterized protein YtfP
MVIKMKEYLFVYGTLQKEKIQMDLFGRTLIGSADVLACYRMSAIKITDIAFLSNGEETYQKTLVASGDKNDMVSGTALEVTGSELLIADSYEPANYKRVSVRLESGKAAWIYIAVGNNEHERL